MTDAPFFSAADAAELRGIARQGFATALQMGPTVNLLLSRDSEQDGTARQIGPQAVLVRYADRQERRSAGAATALTESDGTFSRFAPFDVQPGDRFTLPSGAFGRITLAEEPVNGIARARFRLEAGGG